MVKRLLFFILALNFFQISEVFSQISGVTVDPGPYTPGSSIAATFSIGSTCIRPGNRFNLYLVRPDGSEVNPPIGYYNGFYSTFVNGTLPSGIPIGNGYKLRIKSTTPALISSDSAPFNIQAGTPVTASISSFPELAYDAAGKAEVFGYCPGKDNIEFSFNNNSTASSIVTSTIKNEITNAFEAPLTFNSGPTDPSFMARLGHYTAFVTSRLNGTVGTRAYLIVNNNINNSFGTTGSNIVCLPGGFLQYSVDLTEVGIKNNFPGTTYEIKWGDGNGASEIFTICDLAAGYARHEYTISSCGQPVYNTGNGDQYNVFGINISAVSPFCPGAGAGLSTFVRVVTKPENNFTSPPAGCTGSTINFTNTSVAGQTEANTPACTDNNIRYNWYVDNVRVAINQPRSYVLPHRFTTPGIHTVRLESVVSGQCNGTPITREICIQDPPQPAFDFNNQAQTGCAPFTIQAFDRSVIDERCNTDNVYNWIVSPSAGVSFNPRDKNPIFTFQNPGTYAIILEIQTASCGAVRTQIPQQIVLADGVPVVRLSPNVTLCTLNTLDFNTTPGPTNTFFSGTQVDQPDTYTWSVTAPNGSALDPVNDYSFVNGTGINTKFPSIQFKRYIPYKISVRHKNTCRFEDASQIITFSVAPEPKIDPVSKICYNASATLNATITGGSYIDYVWSTSGDGTFTNKGTLTPTYTPGPTERELHKASVTLTLNTGIDGDCKFVPVSIDIDIFPNNTGINTTQTICTGDRATHPLISTVPGSAFSWVATNADRNATGFTASGTTDINEAITNTNATQNAVVLYTITPIADGCPGVPFTFTVTITPRPAITAIPAKATICSEESTSIALNSNLSGTTYTWTSLPANGATGGTSNSTPAAVTDIDDVLTNIGTTPGTVTYTITPHSATGCPGTPFIVVINVDPALTVAKAGIDKSICATTSYTMEGNTAIVGTGTWTPISANASAVTFADPNSPTTLVNGLSPGNSYTFRWTISASGACNESFDDVTIIVNEPTIPGTTSTSKATVCQDINTGTITLTGSLGNVLRWESSLDGTTWITAENTNTTTTYTFNNLSVPTHFRAVLQNGGCTIENSTPTTINISPATTIAAAGTDQVLCSETSVDLKANPVVTGETGVWTLISGNTNAQITTPDNEETTVTNLIAGQTYVFRWTITGNSPCGSTFDEVSIINNPLIAQNTINTVSVVCNGQQVIINGSVPSGGNGTYTYTWERKLDSGAWSVISNETGKDLTVTLTTTGIVSFRRNVTSGSCTSTSNEFPITVQPPITRNTIAADQIICSGKMPSILTGSVPFGGNGSYLYQWQSSTDGTTWTDIPGALMQNYQPPILTQSIFYRRTVGTLACSGTFQNASASVKITVNQNAEAEFTWTTDTGCAPYNLPITTVPYLDRNATYTWYANDVLQPSTGSSFPGYTITNSNQFVTIKLVVTSSLGCSQDEFEHTFGTNQAVPASFTPVATSDCGPLTVNFVNTSLQTASATFRWNFGNGKTSNDANPEPVVFQVDPSGKDTTYTVTLYSETTCGIDSAKGTVLVKSGPRPVFSPSTTNGCSPLPVIFSNNSPLQVGTTYVFDFGDGSPTVPMSDRSDVPHTYRTTTNAQSFVATMTATNECGTVTSVPYTIVVKPNTVRANLIVNGDQLTGCAPFTATFDNNSTGATSFSVDFKDGSQPRPSFSAPERFQHIFTLPGSYDVTLTATNGCSTNTSTVTITVLPQPSPSFTADNTLGCPGMVVQFRNTTPDAQSNSFIWDFGDGSTSTDLEPPSHTYNGNQEYYTVTLTASNAQGCPNTVVMNQYIHIVQPPVAAFNVNPSTEISIPDYTFNFQDESANNPSLWEWDFGDETGSALKNPSHTYLDTGTYKVTLKTTNQQGCFTTTFKNVTIKGVPGYLFVPNSFVPGDTRPELREFRAKGSGIQSWRLSIFNKWGQQIWETTKLDEGKPADGWDGTFKGQALPQGVYYWKIDVQMVNGAEWKGMTYDKSAPKRTGAIHLIR